MPRHSCGTCRAPRSADLCSLAAVHRAALVLPSASESIQLIPCRLPSVPPKVSLLQKNSSSPVVCHATGFYPANLNITWRKNGKEYHDHVETGETLPNLDETFQKRVILRVKTEEWKRHQYSCVVQHKILIKDIQKILTEDEIISNNKTNKSSHNPFIVGIIIGVIIGFIVIGLIVPKMRT